MLISYLNSTIFQPFSYWGNDVPVFFFVNLYKYPCYAIWFLFFSFLAVYTYLHTSRKWYTKVYLIWSLLFLFCALYIHVPHPWYVRIIFAMPVLIGGFAVIAYFINKHKAHTNLFNFAIQDLLDKHNQYRKEVIVPMDITQYLPLVIFVFRDFIFGV